MPQPASQTTTQTPTQTASQESPVLCNCRALRQAARHVTRFYDACLSEIGIRSTQYTILTALATRRRLTMAELADSLVMDRATMGHNLRPLERDGLIVIRVGEHDRREREVTLSEAGKQMHKLGRSHWKKAQTRFEREFGAENAQVMRQALASVAGLNLPAPGAEAARTATAKG